MQELIAQQPREVDDAVVDQAALALHVEAQVAHVLHQQDGGYDIKANEITTLAVSIRERSRPALCTDTSIPK